MKIHFSNHHIVTGLFSMTLFLGQVSLAGVLGNNKGPQLRLCPSVILSVDWNSGGSKPRSSVGSKAGTQNSNSSVTPKTENVESNDQQSLYNSLDDLTKRLEKLVEAKNELLQDSLLKGSKAVFNLNDASNDLYEKIITQIRATVSRLSVRFSFYARISVLPEKLCNDLDRRVEFRENNFSEWLNSRAPVPKSTHDTQNIQDTERFSTAKYNRDPDAAWNEQKDIRLEAMVFNIHYKVSSNKSKSEKTSGFTVTSSAISSDNPPKFSADVFGSVLVSLPRHFYYPFNIFIPLSYSTDSVCIQTPLCALFPALKKDIPTNLIFKELFFQYNPKYPDKKNYVLFNLDKLRFTSEPQNDDLTRLLQKDTEGHIYFTDEVFYDFIYSKEFMRLSASLERPLGSLLVHIVTEECEKLEGTKSRSILTNQMAKMCDLIGRLNLSLNHLVLDFEPYLVRKSVNDKGTKTLLPVLRLPDTTKGEVGGCMLLPRMFSLFGSKADRKEFLNFYLNGEGPQLAGYKPLLPFLKKLYNNVVVAVNQSLLSKVLGASAVYTTLGDSFKDMSQKMDSAGSVAEELSAVNIPQRLDLIDLPGRTLDPYGKTQSHKIENK